VKDTDFIHANGAMSFPTMFKQWRISAPAHTRTESPALVFLETLERDCPGACPQKPWVLSKGSSQERLSKDCLHLLLAKILLPQIQIEFSNGEDPKGLADIEKILLVSTYNLAEIGALSGFLLDASELNVNMPQDTTLVLMHRMQSLGARAAYAGAAQHEQNAPLAEMTVKMLSNLLRVQKTNLLVDAFSITSALRLAQSFTQESP
jgi:hypothetical protein